MIVALATPLVGGLVAFLVQRIDRVQGQKSQVELHLQRILLIEKLIGVGGALSSMTGNAIDLSVLHAEFDDILVATRLPPSSHVWPPPQVAAQRVADAGANPDANAPHARSWLSAVRTFLRLRWLILPMPRSLRGAFLTFLYYLYILLGVICFAGFTAVAFMPDTKYPNEELGLHIGAVVMGTVTTAALSWVAILCRHWAVRNHRSLAADDALRSSRAAGLPTAAP